MQCEGILPNAVTCDVVSWSALIVAGYGQGHVAGEQAFDCFEEMQREGILPDAVMCLCA
jgi:pentatricopeptide repeat protein